LYEIYTETKTGVTNDFAMASKRGAIFPAIHAAVV